MDKKIKACLKPHALAHSLAGLGVGFLLLAWMPALAMNALMIGVVAVVVAVVWDFMVNKG